MLQLRKPNAVVREECKTPTLIDRQIRDHFPALVFRERSSWKQAQFGRREHCFSQLLNFSPHFLQSGIGYSVKHTFSKQSNNGKVAEIETDGETRIVTKLLLYGTFQPRMTRITRIKESEKGLLLTACSLLSVQSASSAVRSILCHTNVTKLPLLDKSGVCYFHRKMPTLDPPAHRRNIRVVTSPAVRRFRTAWISDLHLGTRNSKAAAFLEFLRNHDFETLYIVGDLIDVWQMRRGIYWPQQHNDVIQKLLRKSRKGTRIIYVPGNHDEFLGGFCGYYGHIAIANQFVHTTVDGQRILVIHGHELDTVVQNARWLAFAGDVGYQLLLLLNPLINFVRRKFGLGYWSLSAYAKQRVKDAVNFIGEFEKAIVRYAERFAVDAVLCGHIHNPGIRRIGNITYYNCGDWVESCSALVENLDGTIELLSFNPFCSKSNIMRPELAEAAV